jgi:hypothetical protein
MIIMNITLGVFNSLEKVFPGKPPGAEFELKEISALRGETVSCQAVCYYDADVGEARPESARFFVESPLESCVTLRKVGYIPSLTPVVGRFDGDVLSCEAGIFPDILLETPDGNIKLAPGQYRSVWIDFDLPEDQPAGSYPAVFRLNCADGTAAEASLQIDVIAASLPEQSLIHTEWLHGDCIADYYETEVFSEQWWAAVRNFIKTAARRGVNMILTPIFTPPLDTAVGGERTTVQLVGVKLDAGKYAFDFANLDRWIRLCLEEGVKYIEISHLYSQWGAKYAPKIMASVDGAYIKLFGWHTAATSPEYAGFLAEFLPALTGRLRSLGVAENAFFHISDEPHGEEHLESYVAALGQAEPYLRGFRIIDALSDYSFYEKGIVKKPIVASDRIDAFIAHGVTGLWTYYCVSQSRKVSNRFVCMPSARNRIIGVMLYKYDIEGFLHWGYNFYNSQNSVERINPFLITDADSSFPSGDPYLVYPGKRGTPVESIRIMVFAEALQDLRAMRLLESLAGREFVLGLIDESSGGVLTFSEYPRGAGFIVELRETINREIAKRI